MEVIKLSRNGYYANEFFSGVTDALVINFKQQDAYVKKV